MASYPFGMRGLLLAPPPPPPPPTINPEAAEKGPLENIVNSSLHSNHPPVHVMQTAIASGMMIPPSHLSLPPPPPPPPEGINSPSCVGRFGFPNDTNTSHHNLIRHRNLKPPTHGKTPHLFVGGPPVWAPQRQTPSGLQGPWQPPSSECPSGVLEELHPPGVSDQAGEEDIRTSSESNPPLGAVIETRSSSASTAQTYKEHRGDPKDSSMPRELTDLFEALHCKLCEVLSSSTIQARHHYTGKPHEKKVRNWLLKWSNETGQPVPKRQKIETVDINPQDLYCQVCDVAFTSVKHGEQHKMGKPHQKALRLGYNPAKSKAKKCDVIHDPSGRFGIGDAFQKTVEPSNNNSEELSDVVTDASTSLTITKNSPLNNKFFCDLCQISTTSQEHLDSHYAGAKHRKNLYNAARSGIKTEVPIIPPPVEHAESILASVISDGGARSRNPSNDLSIFRTPSGQFYCHPCNTTVNSEKSFKEHTESKRHKFKVASSKRP